MIVADTALIRILCVVTITDPLTELALVSKCRDFLRAQTVIQFVTIVHDFKGVAVFWKAPRTAVESVKHLVPFMRFIDLLAATGKNILLFGSWSDFVGKRFESLLGVQIPRFH